MQRSMTAAPVPDHALPYVRDFNWWTTPDMAPQPAGDPYAPIRALHAAGQRMIYMPWTPFAQWQLMRPPGRLEDSPRQL